MKKLLPFLLIFAACSNAPEEQQKELTAQNTIQLTSDQLAQLEVYAEFPKEQMINRTVQG
ncbi:MAG: hypothetical protein RIR06_890, partial [Bacteroidota bacterium]